MRFKGKCAVVTGSSKGIGLASATLLAREGASVILNAPPSENPQILQSALERLRSEGLDVIAHTADMASRQECFELVSRAEKEFSKIDILIANAGICPFADFREIGEELLERVIAVNQKGPFYCAQAAMDAMIRLKIKGRLVFTSSVSAIFGGAQQTHYCPTKGAINQLMKSLAIVGGPHGITSNAVQPGTVITDINRTELEANSELKEYFIRRTPIGRLATPQDVAEAIAFFASDAASCISGTALTVDGGMSVNLQ